MANAIHPVHNTTMRIMNNGSANLVQLFVPNAKMQLFAMNVKLVSIFLKKMII